MKASAFQYHSPSTVEEVLSLLGQYGGECRLLAGGQSLVPAMLQRLAQPGRVVDINRIAKAERPTVVAGRVRIPPLMRHLDFTTESIAGPLGVLMQRLSMCIGALPIRVRGTFLGGLAHADPGSHWGLLSVTMGGDMTLRSLERGARTVGAEDFFQTIWTTALMDDEMLVEAQIPVLDERAVTGFYQVSRPSQYPQAAALVVAEHDHVNWASVRLGICGVEATPRRLAQVERALLGQRLDRGIIREAAEAASQQIDPLTDPMMSADDRRDLIRACVEAALLEAAGL